MNNDLTSVIEDALRYIETMALESILNDECECESDHQTTVCSYKVTHRNVSCIFDQLGCLNAALHGMRQWHYQERHNAVCIECGRNLVECWNIIPV